MYYLGGEYGRVYFTKRESDCLIYLLQGNTIVATAKILGLSSRTVEFYVKNMRMKIGVATKTELLDKMAKMDFAKKYHYEKFSNVMPPLVKGKKSG